MAISSGVNPHRAWVAVNGLIFPVSAGSAEQNATRRSSTFAGQIPLGYTGAELFFSTLDTNDATISVLTGGAQQDLVAGEIDNVSFDYIGGMISFHGRCKSPSSTRKRPPKSGSTKSRTKSSKTSRAASGSRLI